MILRSVFSRLAPSWRDGPVKVPSCSIRDGVGLHDPVGNRRNCEDGGSFRYTFKRPGRVLLHIQNRPGPVPWSRDEPCSFSISISTSTSQDAPPNRQHVLTNHYFWSNADILNKTLKKHKKNSRIARTALQANFESVVFGLEIVIQTLSLTPREHLTRPGFTFCVVRRRLAIRWGFCWVLAGPYG